MKKLIYLPVCLGMLFFSAACENWFDVSPKSDVKAEDLFQQESGFRDVLTGVYSLMSAPESYGRQLSFYCAAITENAGWRKLVSLNCSIAKHLVCRSYFDWSYCIGGVCWNIG